MKKLLLILIALFVATNCYATSMTVPFRCWEEELIREFAKEGINMDKKDPDSDGFIENCGAYYKIHTYKPIPPGGHEPYVQVPRRVFIKMKEIEDGDRDSIHIE